MSEKNPLWDSDAIKPIKSKSDNNSALEPNESGKYRIDQIVGYTARNYTLEEQHNFTMEHLKVISDNFSNMFGVYYGFVDLKDKGTFLVMGTDKNAVAMMQNEDSNSFIRKYKNQNAVSESYIYLRCAIYDISSMDKVLTAMEEAQQIDYYKRILKTIYPKYSEEEIAEKLIPDKISVDDFTEILESLEYIFMEDRLDDDERRAVFNSVKDVIAKSNQLVKVEPKKNTSLKEQTAGLIYMPSRDREPYVSNHKYLISKENIGQIEMPLKMAVDKEDIALVDNMIRKYLEENRMENCKYNISEASYQGIAKYEATIDAYKRFEKRSAHEWVHTVTFPFEAREIFYSVRAYVSIIRKLEKEYGIKINDRDIERKHKEKPLLPVALPIKNAEYYIKTLCEYNREESYKEGHGKPIFFVFDTYGESYSATKDRVNILIDGDSIQMVTKLILKAAITIANEKSDFLQKYGNDISINGGRVDNNGRITCKTGTLQIEDLVANLGKQANEIPSLPDQTWGDDSR